MPAIADGAGSEAALSDYCISEDWSADLEEGVISVGRWTAALHNLGSGRCGLTSLTRAYDPQDRRHILSLFEQAAAAPSSFCFSSSLQLGQGRSQPVFCIARSLREQEECGLTLRGIFIFPRFKVEAEIAEVPLPFIARFA